VSTPPPAKDIRRGDVWWVALDPSVGSEIRKTRPAVVLTADPLNRARHTVVIIPLSTKPKSRPPVTIGAASAGEGAVAVCDQVRAVDKTRLVRRHGRLASAEMQAIDAAMRAILAL